MGTTDEGKNCCTWMWLVTTSYHSIREVICAAKTRVKQFALPESRDTPFPYTETHGANLATNLFLTLG